MHHRPERVAHELKIKVSQIIARELNDPRVGLATVTGAQVSPDLSHARVYVSVLGQPDEQRATLAALNHAAGFIRRALSARLPLRRSPALTFAFDESVERGARMTQLLDDLVKESPDYRSNED